MQSNMGDIKGRYSICPLRICNLAVEGAKQHPGCLDIIPPSPVFPWGCLPTSSMAFWVSLKLLWVVHKTYFLDHLRAPEGRDGVLLLICSSRLVGEWFHTSFAIIQCCKTVAGRQDFYPPPAPTPILVHCVPENIRNTETHIQGYRTI